MANSVSQATLGFQLDDIPDMSINFDEIAKLANMENLDTISGQPPASLEVNLDQLVSQIISEDMPYESTKLSGDNDVGMGQHPASPLHQPQPQFVPQLEYYFSNLDVQPASPEILILQPAVSEPLLQQTATLVPDPIQVADTKLASPEILFLGSTIPEPFSQQALSPVANPQPHPQQALGPESCSIQQLELSQGSADHTSLVASATSSCVLTPPSMWQQKQDEGVASPLPQEAVNTLKKQGCKIKNPKDKALRCRQPKRRKVYELQPLPDKEMEKKRRNAVNAKRHRDMQKEMKQQLSENLAQATAERDRLQMMVNHFKQREQQLLLVLKMHNVQIDGQLHTLNGL